MDLKKCREGGCRWVTREKCRRIRNSYDTSTLSAGAARSAVSHLTDSARQAQRRSRSAQISEAQAQLWKPGVGLNQCAHNGQADAQDPIDLIVVLGSDAPRPVVRRVVQRE